MNAEHTPPLIMTEATERPRTEETVARPAAAVASGGFRIQELDALRGLAALLVVLFHFTMFRPQAGYGFKFGVTGVDLFFIISGYVIFLTVSRVRDWRDFVVSRVARLYPAYWTSVLLTTALMYFFERQHYYPKATLVNLTMLQNFLGVGNLEGAYWTLAVELIFYALMLVLLLTKQLRSTEKWGVIFLGVLLVFHVAGPLVSNPLYTLIKKDLPFLNHAPLFFSGILFYNLQHRPAHGLRHLGIAGCFVFAGYLHNKGGTAVGAITATEHYLILGAYAALFYLFIHGKLTFLVNRGTVFLGTISYSLYLTHYTLGVKVIIAQLEQHGWGFWPASGVALVVALLVASAITFLIERPGNDAIKTYDKRLRNRHRSGSVVFQKSNA